MSSMLKVTTNLTPQAVDVLGASMACTRDTKTDIINRALPVYNIVFDLFDPGGGSIALLKPDGSVDRLYLV
ncbi:hypothetical protein ACI2K4_31465 [Micromonospora sp. NPDC050397]|uniref:hypothetical protein n=1 Tax=Micromonospora sp. NPDC050397 TaxID=3364279 RepID=UPI00384E7A68